LEGCRGISARVVESEIRMWLAERAAVVVVDFATTCGVDFGG